MDNEQFQEFVVKHLMKLTEDMSSTKSSVSSLDGRVSSIEGKMSSIEGKMSSMEGKMSLMENDISSLKSTVLRIETRMENEIIDKIKVLFDGHLQHEHRLNRLERNHNINL
ncbi:MAG: hypothetical protein M1609_16845 [Firmicutes bacterium]|nr:hypothetical protein [Bacillota bacterium]